MSNAVRTSIFRYFNYLCKIDNHAAMNARKIAKYLKKTVLWILGIWMGALLIIQIILLPPIFTRIANSLAKDYINADVSIGKAYGSVFRHFPRITLNVEDLEITYPHERYDSIARIGAQDELLYRGCGEAVDTLASIKRASVSVSLLSLISGDIKLPHIELESPKIFAHYYDENNANWNIFGSPAAPEETPADTTQTAAAGPKADDEGWNIILKNIKITGDPQIVYTDSQDSLFAAVRMKGMSFDGNFETNALHKTMADAHIDDLDISGRYCRDTIAFSLRTMKLADAGSHMHMSAKAEVNMSSEDMGVIWLPLTFSTDLAFPEDQGLAVSAHNISALIATAPLSGDMDIILRDDKAMMNGILHVGECQMQPVVRHYMSQFVPELEKVRTNAKVSVNASIKGHYDYVTGRMPEVNVSVDIPDSKIDYVTFPEKIDIGMQAYFQMDTTGRMCTDIPKARIRTSGLDLNAAGGMYDMTGADPEIAIYGGMRASLDTLQTFIPDSLNIIAKGKLSAQLDGQMRMSDIDMYNFSQAELYGFIKGEGILVQMPKDTIDLRMNGLDINLSPEQITSRRDPSQTFRLMGITGALGNADITYKDAFAFKGQKIDFTAKNSTDNEDSDQQNIRYLGGRFNAELLQLNDSEGTSIKFDKTKNSFQMRPKRGQPTIPVLSVSNKNLRITYITTDNRIILTDSEISADAAMNTIDRARRREAYMDSLARVYPDIPRDSLFIFLRSQRAAKAIPSWMTEDNFRSNDIKLDLNESLRKYFREWDINCKAGIRTGIIMTPYMPLRNILKGASMTIDNNMISIDSLKVMSGESEICADGTVSGLKRVMMGRGNVHLDLNISSGSVNADELLKGYTIGSQYEPKDAESTKEMTNSEFFKQVTTDTVMQAQSAPALFVIPGNLVADIDIDASGIRYKDLSISSFNADMLIKERCAQLTNTSMRSNMGGFDLDAFYVTRSKNDIRTGFCLDVKDVTSERVIGLVPEIDQVLPMIGSIKGLLNCEIAATASLDTTMSIMMPTVNGIARMSGKDLSISDDELYTSVARKLLFRNKKKGEIDLLQVEGTIKDNRLEVFPFILKLDRYTLGLSGVQNMDMSYKHHISVLRSPLLIRLGLNLSGPDYDHMKFRLGRAMYRANKMPSFTAVIDQTKNDLRYSIYSIFETGVETTVENRDINSFIKQHQNEIGYVNAAEMEMEELSEKEMKELEKLEAEDNLFEESMAAAVEAAVKVLKKY